MKGLKIALIAVLSAIVVGLTALMLIGSGGNHFYGGGFRINEGFLFNKYTLQKTDTVSIEDIGKLTVDMSQCGFSVIFLPLENYTGDGGNSSGTDAKDGNNILIEEYFNFKAEETDYAKIAVKDQVLNAGEQKNTADGELRIEGMPNGNKFFQRGWGISSSDGYIKIYLPQKIWHQLSVMESFNSSGDLDFEYSAEELEALMELHSLRAKTGSGDMEFPYVKAVTAELDSSSGYQTIGSFLGESLRMTASSGNLKIGNCQGNLSAKTTSGYQTIGSFQGKNLHMTASSGDLEVDSCQGDLFAKTSSGNIQLGNCRGNLELETSSGEQSVGDCQGNLTAKASSGDITIGNCVGDLRLSASSGYLEVLGGQGGIVASTTSGTVKLLDYRMQKDTQVKVSSGDIIMKLTELSGNISLSGTSGGVDLTLPADADFSFEADTSSGDIYDNFKGNQELELSYNKRGNHAEGSTGPDSEYKIQCNFSSGDVNISSN